MRPPCQLGITSATLSAWQADALDSVEQQRIAQHVTGCAACQARLDRFTRIGAAIRAPVPEPSTQAIWRSLYGRIQGYERAAMQRTQKIAVLSGLGLVGVIVTVFALVVAFFPNHPAVSVTATATTGVTPAATVIQPSPSTTANPLAGWSQVTTLPNPTSIAFSASSPLIGYQCGSSGPIFNKDVTLNVSVTRDGGATWGALLPVPTQAIGCYIAVSPADAADIIATESSCFQDCTGAPQRLYFRSRDGGKSWKPLVLPQAGAARLAFTHPTNSGEPPGTILAYSWAGTTLYAIGIPYTTPNVFALYQSINGAPLALLDLTHNPSVPLNLQTNQIGSFLFSLGNTIYLTLFGVCVPNCPFLTSSDDGATWQTITPGTPLEQIYSAADGKTLYTNGNTQQPVRSVDGGRTWQTFPPLPDGYDLQHAGIAGSTPDGSLFMGASKAQTVAIYRLANGATSWTPEYANLQASLNQSYPDFTTVSADADGRPKTIWALLIDSNNNATLYQHPA